MSLRRLENLLMEHYQITSAELEALLNPPDITDAIPMSSDMTLRDWFAGMALMNPRTHFTKPNEPNQPDDIADQAFAIANAMMTRRLCPDDEHPYNDRPIEDSDEDSEDPESEADADTPPA